MADKVSKRKRYGDTSEKALIRYHQTRDKYYNNITWRLKVMLRNCKQRSKTKELPFDLDLDFLENLWLEQDGCCAITGVEFILEKDDRGSILQNSPSLDRITPSLGYTKNNVRLITYQANVCLHNFGLDSLLSFAKRLVNYQEGLI